MNQEAKSSASQPAATGDAFSQWKNALLGLFAGLAGGLLAKTVLRSWTTRDLFLAALFGLIFGLFFSKRKTRPWAGLIWVLCFAFFLWIAIPAGLGPLIAGFGPSGSMLRDAQEHFPELVAYLVCLGMPVGVALGIRGARSEERRVGK